MVGGGSPRGVRRRLRYVGPGVVELQERIAWRMPYSITWSAHNRRVGGIVGPRARGPEIDHELELRWLLDWELTWLGTLENLVHEHSRAAVHLLPVRSVGDEPKIAHGMTERRARASVGRKHEPAKPVHPPRLLRLGSERRQGHAEDQREPDQSHEQLASKRARLISRPARTTWATIHTTRVTRSNRHVYRDQSPNEAGSPDAVAPPSNAMSR